MECGACLPQAGLDAALPFDVAFVAASRRGPKAGRHSIFCSQGARKIASESFPSITSLRSTDFGSLCGTLAAHGHKAPQPRFVLLRPFRGNFRGPRLADVSLLALKSKLALRFASPSRCDRASQADGPAISRSLSNEI